MTKKHLVDYVGASSDLAESISADIKNKRGISSGTVVLLGKFYAAARNIQVLLDITDEEKSSIN